MRSSIPICGRPSSGCGSGGGTRGGGLVLQAAHQLLQNELDWGVPGLLEQRIAALIKSLPKSYRRALVPAPDTAAWVAKQLSFGQGNFLEEVARRLSQRGGQGITPALFDLSSMDDGLKINVQAVDANGAVVAQIATWTL